MAYGTDPEQIVDLLLAIAARRSGRAPQPAALGPARRAGRFGAQVRPLRVRSRSQPGRPREASSFRRGPAPVRRGEIGIPYPTHEVHLCRVPDDLTRVLDQHARDPRTRVSPRFDLGSPRPASPRRRRRRTGHQVSARRRALTRAFTGRSMISVRWSGLVRSDPSSTIGDPTRVG